MQQLYKVYLYRCTLYKANCNTRYNLRKFVSIETDVVAFVAENLRVRIWVGGGGDGGGHDESEDNELDKKNGLDKNLYK